MSDDEEHLLNQIVQIWQIEEGESFEESEEKGVISEIVDILFSENEDEES